MHKEIEGHLRRFNSDKKEGLDMKKLQDCCQIILEIKQLRIRVQYYFSTQEAHMLDHLLRAFNLRIEALEPDRVWHEDYFALNTITVR